MIIERASENNGNINDNGGSLSVKKVKVYKVSNSDSEIMLNINNKEVFKNRVSKSDTVNNSSHNESR